MASVSAFIVDRDLAELLAEADAAEQQHHADGAVTSPGGSWGGSLGGSPPPDPNLPWAPGHGPGD